jgi:hypothetical protein
MGLVKDRDARLGGHLFGKVEDSLVLLEAEEVAAGVAIDKKGLEFRHAAQSLTEEFKVLLEISILRQPVLGDHCKSSLFGQRHGLLGPGIDIQEAYLDTIISSLADFGDEVPGGERFASPTGANEEQFHGEGWMMFFHTVL